MKKILWFITHEPEYILCAALVGVYAMVLIQW